MKEHGEGESNTAMRPPQVGHIPTDILLQDRNHLQHLVSSVPSPIPGLTLFSPLAFFGADPRTMLSAHLLASIQMATKPDIRFQIPPISVQNAPLTYHSNGTSHGQQLTVLPSITKKEKLVDPHTPVNNNNNNNISNIQQQQQSNQQSRDKIFICPTCDRSFGYKHVLQNHERTHTGEKPFECTICQKKFTRDHHLKTHMRLHTGEKPYQCTHCDRLFVQVANLRRHLRVHTGERPYPCERCQSRFSDSNQLKAHMLIHKGEKPYSCPDCDGRFRRRHHLLHHKCNDKETSPTESLPRSPPQDISPPSGGKRERKSRETRHIIRLSGRPVSTVTSTTKGFGQIIPEQTHPEDLSLNNGNGIHGRHFASSNHSSCSASPSPPSGGSQGSIGIYCRSITSSDPPEYSSDEDRSVTASSSNNGKTESDEASPHV